jgi:hypothetical protein
MPQLAVYSNIAGGGQALFHLAFRSDQGMDTGAAAVVRTPYKWKQNGIFSQPEGNDPSQDPRREINPMVYPHQDQNEQSPTGDLKDHVS